MQHRGESLLPVVITGRCSLLNAKQHKAVMQNRGESLLPVACNELQAGRQPDIPVASAGHPSQHQAPLWQGIPATFLQSAAFRHSSQGGGSSAGPGNMSAAVPSA